MLHGVIMAGGSGTRFWPVSRKNRPKQLLQITGHRTMIRATIERLLPVIPFERIMVITGAAHEQEIRRQVPELMVQNVVAEPRGRNTAPCIALAAHKLLKTDAAAIMAVLPADHLIRKEAEFREALVIGAKAAADGDRLITFGIVPNRPETGYGYIQLGQAAFEIRSRIFFQVQSFVEKPDLATAVAYVAAGNYMWNSGMFIWRAQTIVDAFEKHMPQLHGIMQDISPALNTSEEHLAIEKAYEAVESISIDYGVMENAANVFTLPIDVDWNDVGSWASLDDVWECDSERNAARGLVVALGSSGCVISSTEKLAAVIGLEDVIVVDTPDALLVCKKDKAQDVKKLLELLEERGHKELL